MASMQGKEVVLEQCWLDICDDDADDYHNELLKIESKNKEHSTAQVLYLRFTEIFKQKFFDNITKLVQEQLP